MTLLNIKHFLATQPVNIPRIRTCGSPMFPHIKMTSRILLFGHPSVWPYSTRNSGVNNLLTLSVKKHLCIPLSKEGIRVDKRERELSSESLHA
jgi:hypothetical protein